MARVSNELDVREAMGLTGEAQKAIEEASWVILDCAPDFKYEKVEDDEGKKVNKKTDSQAGVTVLLGGPRKGDKLVRNKEMKVKIDDLWTEDVCDLVSDEMPEVRVSITRAVVWVPKGQNPNFLKADLSIHAKLIDEDGQVFDPRNLKGGNK